MAPAALLPTPQWALRLTAAVCARYHLPRPALRWYASLVSPASAAYVTQGDYAIDPSAITVYTSSSTLEDRLILLHELAHHIHYCRTQKDTHSPLFWHYCWTLYRLYRVPLHQAILSEFGYMASAETVFQQMGIRLSPQGRIAAELGRAERATARLHIRIRHLRTALKRLRSPKTIAPARQSLYALHAAQRDTARLHARHARAYKRIVKSS